MSLLRPSTVLVAALSVLTCAVLALTVPAGGAVVTGLASTGQATGGMAALDGASTLPVDPPPQPTRMASEPEGAASEAALAAPPADDGVDPAQAVADAAEEADAAERDADEPEGQQPREAAETGGERQGLLPAVDPGAVERLSARTGIPARALQAYAGAALHQREEAPGCQLDWVLLAAIGWVESHHGTLDGGHIRDDGRMSAPVVGPALNGSGDVRAIADTDGGELDGDARWDRAVGPMQFIPSSWQRYGVDATGDGVADPQHIDDAALSAARYLCAAGDLSDPDRWWQAVLSYNRSEQYARSVLNANNHYAQLSRDG